MTALDLRAVPQGLTLRVRVTPRAAREALGSARAGALLVRLTAPPVEGAANEALRRLLARSLGVAAGAVSVLRGASARDKLVCISGVEPERVQALAVPAARPVAAADRSPRRPGRARGRR